MDKTQTKLNTPHVKYNVKILPPIINNSRWIDLGVVSTIILMVLWDFLMFHLIFLSPQVKRCAIITYKHGIYE